MPCRRQHKSIRIAACVRIYVHVPMNWRGGVRCHVNAGQIRTANPAHRFSSPLALDECNCLLQITRNSLSPRRRRRRSHPFLRNSAGTTRSFSGEMEEKHCRSRAHPLPVRRKRERETTCAPRISRNKEILTARATQVSCVYASRM